MRKGAFTFVEAIVAVAIGSILLGSAWAMLSSSSRQGKKTDIKLQGVKSGLIFVQRFEHDLRRIHLDDKHDIVISPDAKKGISFYIYDTKNSSLTDRTIKIKKVRYFFSEKKCAIYRAVEDSRPRRLKGSYEALVFCRHKDHNYLEKVPTKIAPQGMLTVLVTGTPKAVLKKPKKERSSRDRTTFWCSFPLRARNGRLAYLFWQANCTSFPVE